MSCLLYSFKTSSNSSENSFRAVGVGCNTPSLSLLWVSHLLWEHGSSELLGLYVSGVRGGGWCICVYLPVSHTLHGLVRLTKHKFEDKIIKHFKMATTELKPSVGPIWAGGTVRLRVSWAPEAGPEPGWTQRKNFLEINILKCGNGIPRETVAFPTLEIFKNSLIVSGIYSPVGRWMDVAFSPSSFLPCLYFLFSYPRKTRRGKVFQPSEFGEIARCVCSLLSIEVINETGHLIKTELGGEWMRKRHFNTACYALHL